MSKKHLWWQYGLIYQIYPRSFKDSNGDGIGDLPGIISQLDYLKWLGVTACWLSPIYPSPMADFGYDISNYTDVDTRFGNMADFEKLLEEAHKRDIKIILDLVPNHTSSLHPWFVDSRLSRESAKRDWYIWRDPLPDGSPPNNWLSMFGGSAWEWDETTKQYYYHAFLKEQPDLNWRNPEVEQAMLGVMKFWLDKGVDGFRIDVLWHIIKDKDFRDNPPNPNYSPNIDVPYNQHIPAFSTDQPEVHEYVTKMRALTNQYQDKVLIGEIYLPVEKLVTYYGPELSGLHMPFNFQLLLLPWHAKNIFAAIDLYEATLPKDAWPNWVLGNHDNKRIISRIGKEQAKVAAILLLTLRGTPTLYYGDELGMEDIAIPKELIQDPQAINQQFLVASRDPARTPMQWDESINAGFTTGVPWLPISSDYKSVNVAVEKNNSDSMLSLYKRLIELRQSESALHVGEYVPIGEVREMLAYVRKQGDNQLLIVLNLSAEPDIFSSEHHKLTGEVILSTHKNRQEIKIVDQVELAGNEAVIIRLTAQEKIPHVRSE